MHHVRQAAALQTQVQLAASQPLRTSAAGGDGVVARGVAAGGARRCGCNICYPWLSVLRCITYCKRWRC